VALNPRIEDLRRRLEKEPGSRIFAQLAEELRKEGDFAEAIRVSRSGLAQHPSYPSARMTLGRALFDSGDLAAARGEFEAVLRGAPDNILASRFLAESLEAMGDLGSALLQYRAALRLAPGDRQLELQIRSLEQKLTPPRRPTDAAPPARGAVMPPPSRPTPAAEPALPPVAALPPGFEPGASTIILPTSAPAGRFEAAPAPPIAQPPRPAPPAPPPVPAAPPLLAPPAAAVAAPREESFEMDGPFGGGLHAPERPSRRPLDFDDRLEHTLDDTLDGTLPGRPAPKIDDRSDTPTGPRYAISLPPDRPSRPALERPEGGTRPVPVISRVAPEASPAVSDAAPPLPAPAAPPLPRPEAVPAGVAPPPDVAVAPAEPGEGGGPPPAPWRPDTWPESKPDSVRAPLPPIAPIPVAEPERVAQAAAAGEAPPLSSSTLAELYLRQGFADKAIEVYQQLLQREPGNEQARARVVELSKRVATGAPASSPPASPPPEAPVSIPPLDTQQEERAGRRRDIERTIARLEELLATVRRHAPAGGAK
jgi:hypothetical protein